MTVDEILDELRELHGFMSVALDQPRGHDGALQDFESRLGKLITEIERDQLVASIVEKK